LFLHHSWKVTETSSAVSISWGTETQPRLCPCSLDRSPVSLPPHSFPWLRVLRLRCPISSHPGAAITPATASHLHAPLLRWQVLLRSGDGHPQPGQATGWGKPPKATRGKPLLPAIAARARGAPRQPQPRASSSPETPQQTSRNLGASSAQSTLWAFTAERGRGHVCR